jgi:hypothetical protein
MRKREEATTAPTVTRINPMTIHLRRHMTAAYSDRLKTERNESDSTISQAFFLGYCHQVQLYISLSQLCNPSRTAGKDGDNK